MLGLLANLRHFPSVGHDEILHLTDQRRLWGRGLNAVDVHLMAAVALVPGAQLWTRDKRLKSACSDTGVQLFDERLITGHGRRRNIRQAPVDHNAQAMSTG